MWSEDLDAGPAVAGPIAAWEEWSPLRSASACIREPASPRRSGSQASYFRAPIRIWYNTGQTSRSRISGRRPSRTRYRSRHRRYRASPSRWRRRERREIDPAITCPVAGSIRAICGTATHSPDLPWIAPTRSAGRVACLRDTGSARCTCIVWVEIPEHVRAVADDERVLVVGHPPPSPVYVKEPRLASDCASYRYPTPPRHVSSYRCRDTR